MNQGIQQRTIIILEAGIWNIETGYWNKWTRMVKMELFNLFTVMIVIKEETFLQSYIAKQTPLTIIKQCLMKSARGKMT